MQRTAALLIVSGRLQTSGLTIGSEVSEVACSDAQYRPIFAPAISPAIPKTQYINKAVQIDIPMNRPIPLASAPNRIPERTIPAIMNNSNFCTYFKSGHTCDDLNLNLKSRQNYAFRYEQSLNSY